jgi:hypothetical protein
MSFASLHALIFALKKGAALKAAAPFVKEVYSNTYPKSSIPKQDSPHALRSVKLGQIGHISYHSIPYTSGLCALLFLAAIWSQYPLSTKITTLVVSFLYSFQEFTFTFFERGRSYTSLGQLLGNLVYTPILLDCYPLVLTRLGLDGPVFFVLLYPVNVWILEVVEDLFIIKPIYGRNVAWCYLDYKDEFVDGIVRVGHIPAWWALGGLAWLIYDGVKVAIEAAVEGM